jgi:1,2-diacylglycerol 3-alpha-glucosyltransferase
MKGIRKMYVRKSAKIKYNILTCAKFFDSIGGIERSIEELIILDVSHSNMVLCAIDPTKMPNKKIFCIKRYKGTIFLAYKWSSIAPVNVFLSAVILIYLKKNNRIRNIVCRDIYFAFASCFLRMNTSYLAPGINAKEGTHAQSWNFLIYINHMFKNFIQLYTLRNIRKVFVFSENMKKQVEKIRRKNNINIVKSGINSNKFQLSSDKKNISSVYLGSKPRDSVTLLYMGRFTLAKNIKMLLDSYQNLSIPDAKLVLVGDGPELKNCINYAKNIEKPIEFIGATKNPEKYYALGDVLVFPSQYEPFGHVLLEGMVMGLRVVHFSNDIPNVLTATEEVYPDKYRSTAYSLDPKAFSEAIIHAVEHPISKLEIRSFAIKNYSWKHTYNSIFKFK